MKRSEFAETLKNAIPCPIHGKVHLAYFMTPDPGEFKPAVYVCAACEKLGRLALQVELLGESLLGEGRCKAADLLRQVAEALSPNLEGKS